MLDQLVAELLKVPAHVWREMFGGLLQYDDLAELKRINAPTLLVWGDADALVAREMQDQLVRLIPAGDLLVYPGVGHTPRWEDPSRFAFDVTAFAERSLPTPATSPSRSGVGKSPDPSASGFEQRTSDH